MSEMDEKLRELMQLRDHTLDDISKLREELQVEIEPAPATDDDAAADVAADIYERGKVISLIRNLEAKLHSLERAISLAKEGTYGICEKCGAQIPEERLKIMPETTLCVRCASELERGIRRVSLLSSSRQAEEEYYTDEEDEEDYQDSDESED